MLLEPHTVRSLRARQEHIATPPMKQTARRKLQALLRQILALLPQTGLSTPSPATASVRLMCRRRLTLRRELPPPPAESAETSLWGAFRTAVCTSLARITTTIRTIGRVERKVYKRHNARQRRADFEAARYRAFLDSAEDRQHTRGGITSVTVPDTAVSNALVTKLERAASSSAATAVGSGSFTASGMDKA